jgi:catechol 2,3-dioxygenase-like lactoylglutathione lyase family enzyme
LPGHVGTEFEHGAVVFFDLQPGLLLAIWPRADLAHDAGLPRSQPSATALSLGHNVNSQEDVDAVMERARHAGASIVKPARPRSGAATPGTSRTRTATCGRSRGTRRWWCRSRDASPFDRVPGMEEVRLSKLLAWVGATLLGALGWWAGEREGMFTAFVLSMVGTGVGLYLGRRMAAHLLD